MGMASKNVFEWTKRPTKETLIEKYICFIRTMVVLQVMIILHPRVVVKSGQGTLNGL